MTTASQKLYVARKLLQSGSFTASLDPRRLGVEVPQRFKPLSQLDVRVKGGPGGPHDAALREHGIVGMVRTMNNEKIHVSLPWHSIFALIGQGDPTSGKFWGADCPVELRERLAAIGGDGRRRMVSGVQSNVISLAAYRQRKAGCT
jgi:hypothetical protein